MTHENRICNEVRASTHYSGKSYSVRFVCPDCGRTGRANLSFLGLRKMVCNGKKFLKLYAQEVETWYEHTADQHASGDAACGRKWECACGGCRVARKKGYVPKKEAVQ